MTFSDIFKSSFLENATSISVPDMIIGMVLSFLIGFFIYLIYKKTFNGVMYSRSFGITLIALTMVTTLVILAVTSNIVLSLGMVGALSIVRFRTAIKEPLDIAFLFWSIAAGIVLAAGLIPLALIGSAFIGVVLVLFVNHKGHETPYILVLRCRDEAAENAARTLLDGQVKRSLVKSKSASAEGVELNVEIRLKDESTAFVSDLAALDGVRSAVLVSYSGEYMN